MFLVAVSRHGERPNASELPPLQTQVVAPGRPDPTVARLRLGEYLRIQPPGREGDRYAAVLVDSDPNRPVLHLESAQGEAPLVRALAPGDEVVTVLIEPMCANAGACRQYRQNLGAVRVTVVP